jgi:hypothetical protein
VALPDPSTPESPAQAHHVEPHEHSMQSSHPTLPVFGLAGVTPASFGAQIGPPLGQPASAGTGQVLWVVA